MLHDLFKTWELSHHQDDLFRLWDALTKIKGWGPKESDEIYLMFNRAYWDNDMRILGLFAKAVHGEADFNLRYNNRKYQVTISPNLEGEEKDFMVDAWVSAIFKCVDSMEVSDA